MFVAITAICFFLICLALYQVRKCRERQVAEIRDMTHQKTYMDPRNSYVRPPKKTKKKRQRKSRDSEEYDDRPEGVAAVGAMLVAGGATGGAL